MQKRIRRMFEQGLLVISGFMLFLWLSMAFIISSIYSALNSSHARSIIIVAGVAVLLCATVSLIMLIVHLRRGKDEIYAEELGDIDAHVTVPDNAHQVDVASSPQATPHHSDSVMVKIFDIMFVMLLCFSTLLVTMLLRGHTVNTSAIYSLNPASAISIAVLVLGFTGYFSYILRHSKEELTLMVREMYDAKADAPDEKQAT